MLEQLKVYLQKPVQRGAAELDRLAKIQKTLARSGSAVGSGTTTVTRPLKQLAGSRITRKSI